MTLLQLQLNKSGFFCRSLTSQRARVSGHLLLVQDLQALVEAVHGGHGGGLQHQQILVQGGKAGRRREALYALDQISVLALGLGHHLETKPKRFCEKDRNSALWCLKRLKKI